MSKHRQKMYKVGIVIQLNQKIFKNPPETNSTKIFMNYLIRKVKYLVIKMYNEQKYCDPSTLMASQVDFKFKASLGFVMSSRPA